MSGWRRIRAGLFVATVFGLIWATCISLVQLVVFLVFDGLGGVSGFGQMMALIFLLLFVLGAIQGLLLAGGMAVAGRHDSVDSFSRLKAGVLGAVFGAIGPTAIWLVSLVSLPDEITVASPWGIVATSAAFGALATTSLLAVARRGALPPSPAEPKKIGS